MLHPGEGNEYKEALYWLTQLRSLGADVDETFPKARFPVVSPELCFSVGSSAVVALFTQWLLSWDELP